VSLDRRSFLTRSAALLGTGGLAAAGTAEVAGHAAPAAAAAQTTTDPAAAQAATLNERVPFDALHQSGIITAAGAEATVAALDAIAPDRATLATALQALSSRARQLADGTVLGPQEVDEPPADSGTLGTTVAPDALTITIGFGATLFDDRYGLAKQMPAGLKVMPRFPDDTLDDAQSHGDILLQITANRRDTVVHALRELLRPVRNAFSLRWAVDGFQSADRGPTARSARRNLFGFRDGTSNPDVTDDAAMKRLIWVPGDTGPAWTTDGTFQVVRTIRMHVEFWDRVGLREQENMIGRSRPSGAPLGGTDELQDPRLDLDPEGERIPMDAHIRLANPRDAATADQRILRRGYNYSRGFDTAGQLDQGLVFIAFNQDLERQFEAVQGRIAGEPMIDYITPVGGGYFFVPRGSAGPTDWVGSGAFA
jgi:deferrochelatase/peroxidase EfeB